MKLVGVTMSSHPKILIIGAGCSRNYTEGYNKQILKPPIDSDFFQVARKVILKAKDDDYSVLNFQGVIDDLHRLYGYRERNTLRPWLNTPDAIEYTEVLDDQRLSLEKVMTQLSLEREMFERTPTILGHPRSVNYSNGSLAALIELITITIYEALKGPPCSNHLKLAGSLGPGDAVLSFNYDLLMDNALANAGKLTDSGYMVNFQKSLSYDEWTRSDEQKSEVTLLKLHGSMNWLHCSSCNAYLLTRSEKIGPWNVSLPKACPNCGESGEYFERVIVPPILAKDYTVQPLKSLWNHARRYAERTKEVIIIGYSFPPTDFAAESLLRTSLPWASQRQVHFTIVNPDKTVFERFKAAFNSSTVEWKASLEEYLTTI